MGCDGRYCTRVTSVLVVRHRLICLDRCNLDEAEHRASLFLPQERCEMQPYRSVRKWRKLIAEELGHRSGAKTVGIRVK